MITAEEANKISKSDENYKVILNSISNKIKEASEAGEWFVYIIIDKYRLSTKYRILSDLDGAGYEVAGDSTESIEELSEIKIMW